MILLFDGLDEIEDAATNEQISEAVDDLARQHPRCTIILTSRPVGLRREDYARFRPLDLAPMESAMIDDYLQRWFGDETDKIEQLRRTFPTGRGSTPCRAIPSC